MFLKRAFQNAFQQQQQKSIFLAFPKEILSQSWQMQSNTIDQSSQAKISDLEYPFTTMKVSPYFLTDLHLWY